MKFHSKIDWWMYGFLLITAAYMLSLAFVTGVSWLYFALFLVIFLIEYVLIAGLWYEVTESELVVYWLFRPKVYPIEKIKSVRHVRSSKSGAALSSHRVAITFADNTALNNRLPLEISPKDHDGFVKRLQAVNQNICVE
jgi:hypothetical protein